MLLLWVLPASFFFKETATTEIYTLSLHDALPISWWCVWELILGQAALPTSATIFFAASSRSSAGMMARPESRSEEHTSELQSQANLVCRLLLEKKNQVHRAPALDDRSGCCRLLRA